MIPLNIYFYKFDDVVLHNAFFGTDFFHRKGDLLRFVNLKEDIARFKLDYPLAYRLANESIVRIGFIFLYDSAEPVCSYASICNPFDGRWISFVIVRRGVTQHKMEHITIKAISDCYLKMVHQ